MKLLTKFACFLTRNSNTFSGRGCAQNKYVLVMSTKSVSMETLPHEKSLYEKATYVKPGTKRYFLEQWIYQTCADTSVHGFVWYTEVSAQVW